MKVLITGGGGYLGTVLSSLLLAKGHQVTVVDRFFWGKSLFKPHHTLSLIKIDTRNITKEHLANIDAVIDLAALSNDPIAELDPQKTFDINHKARSRTAALAKEAGVPKYILASSCSVYGFQDGLLTETSPTAPITTYAKASLFAEQETLKLTDNSFSVTALRQGTLYGLSPRMRFDLVVNAMALSLFKNNFIEVHGGSQWRPIVHVKDSAEAFVKTLEADPIKVNGEIFNVGDSQQNYQMSSLAELISSVIPGQHKIITHTAQHDARSYQVSFDKIHNILGYAPEKNPQMGAKEVYSALTNKQVHDSRKTYTVEWYKYLLTKNPNALSI